MMSNEVSNPEAWPSFTMLERRVLGVLVEKAKTTPDTYPLSLNALVTGCNQKSNRDPLMNVDEDDAAETLATLQSKKALTTRIIGGRVERWRHNLYEAWKVSKVELAVIAELLLRGPQTEGDLRGRASRMEPIDSLEDLREVLVPLAERRLVVWLGEPGRRGALVTHGFHAPFELQKLREHPMPSAAEPASPAAPSAKSDPAPFVAELAEMRKSLADVTDQLTQLRREFDDLKKSLGA